LRLDGAGQKTSDRRIAMTFQVAENFCRLPYYYVYIYSKTPYNNSHDDMTFSSRALPYPAIAVDVSMTIRNYS
jgi:hypothetical protein